MRPLRRLVFVYDIRFASSGTRNPRQPISSPDVIETFCITPPVAMQMMARANEAHEGNPFNPSPSATKLTTSEFQPASCSAQTTTHATEAYASGTQYAAAS